MDESEVLKKIKALRLEAGISEDAMGQHIGYNAKVVLAIETGNRPIGLKTLIKWSDAAGKRLVVDFV